MAKRKRVLICLANYLPGYKSGGPIRSITNMVTYLSDRFDFYVVTRDRDAADTQRYSEIITDCWCDVGNAKVWYCSSINSSLLCRVVRETKPDLVYLNSFQDAFTRVMVRLRRMCLLGNTPVLLAPRGEFAPAAMGIKRSKKVLYRHAARLLGLHENLSWHVTSVRERNDLLNAAPARHLDPGSIYLARNISQADVLSVPHVAKESGSVKLAFVGRMSEMKNLCFMLDILPKIHGRVELNLFGPVGPSDTQYWKRCVAQIEQLPENIKVEYKGSIDSALVPQTLHDHHFFVLPTKGENFCHAAVESFVNGTPVVLSDETPWTGLAKVRAGFDIPLEDRSGWTAALQACADMSQATHTSYLDGAKEYGRQFSPERAVAEYLEMFEAAMNECPAA
ncbi:MAG: glycosyltransferase family 4 protein [Terracidiphilus sp.]